MKVNYGVNRPVAHKGKRRLLKHRNGKLDFPLYTDDDWESADVHQQIRRVIRDENPGWSITGYALASAAAKP